MEAKFLPFAAAELGRTADYLFQLTYDKSGQFYGLLCPPSDDYVTNAGYPFVLVFGERRDVASSDFPLRITIRGGDSEACLLFKETDKLSPLVEFEAFLASTANRRICPTENELLYFAAQHGGVLKLYS